MSVTPSDNSLPIQVQYLVSSRYTVIIKFDWNVRISDIFTIAFGVAEMEKELNT